MIIPMRHAHGWVLAIAVFAGCGDGTPPQELEGVYRVTERLEGDCDGALEPGTVSPTNRFFELVYNGELGRDRLEYRRCDDASTCSSSAVQDLSFGPGGSNWNGILATASTGCVLRYRLRELFLTDDGVEIIQTTYGETDESLTPEECDPQEARDRARRMPCLSVVETQAERL